MQNEEMKTQNLQKKSHELLIKLLNNIGIVGSILASIADIVLVIIFVIGIKIDINITSTIIFSILNTIIGVLINCLLRYQGQKFAEIENEELCKQYYHKKIKEKKHLSLMQYNIVQTFKDIIIKGGTSFFLIFGSIYISIKGSENPVQILITLVTLILFACFGLIAMNSSYERFYNYQVPLMELKIKENKENEVKENVVNKGRKCLSYRIRTDTPFNKKTFRAVIDK